MMALMKTCSNCRKELDVSCFGKRTRSKDGLCAHCKTCGYEMEKRQRASRFAAHPEAATEFSRKHSSLSKEWNNKNKDKTRKSCKDWRAKNRAKSRDYAKQWAKNNPNKVRANQKAAIERLSKSYVVQCLRSRNRSLLPSKITTELIKIKREQLLLRRLARQLKQELTKRKEDHESK